MYVHMHAVLACRFSNIDTDVEAIRREACEQVCPRLMQKAVNSGLLHRRHFEEISHMAPRDDDYVALA
jgi:hypothetical protein